MILSRALPSRPVSVLVPCALVFMSVVWMRGMSRGVTPAEAVADMRVIDLAEHPQTVITGAQGKDQLGNDMRAGDINGDGIDDLVMGAHWGSEGGRNIVGRAYALHGRSEWPASIDLSNRLAADWWVMGVGSEARMGSAVAAGDISGDGIDDFLIGSLLANPFSLPLGANVGAVYALLGAEGGGGRWDLLNTNPDIIIGGGTSPGGADQLGTDLVLGDIDGDGAIDLFAAAMNRDGRKGGVLGWWGPIADDARIDASETPPDVLIEGVVPNGYLGATIEVGDLNADGIDDLIIGAVAVGDLTPASNGAVVVFFGGTDFPARHRLADGPAPLTIVGRPLSGLASAFSAGRCACRGRPIVAADVNGDGLDDLVIGAIQDADRLGSVHVIAGPLGPGVIDLATAEHFMISGPIRDSRFGWSVEAGDLDGDGRDDLIIAAPFVDVSDRTKAGQVFGIRGPLPRSGVMDITEGAALRVDGRSESDGDAGLTLVLADTDGDGIDDLHIGFPDGDPGGKLSVGEVHRLSGPVLDPLPTPSPTSSTVPSSTATATGTGTSTPDLEPTLEPPATSTSTPIPTFTPTDESPAPTPSDRHRIHFPLLTRRY